MLFQEMYGYVAPETHREGAADAVLDMPAVIAGAADALLPDRMAVWVRVVTVLCTYDVTLCRVHQGASGGATPLYQPGRVLLDGSETLKPFSKTHHIDLLFDGIEDAAEVGAGWAAQLGWRLGARVWRKTFPVTRASIQVETVLVDTDRGPVLGLKKEGAKPGVLPLYPFGGFVPPRGQIDQAEPVFFFPTWDTSGGVPVTALKLYRQSFLESRGGFPPHPFYMDKMKWFFEGVVADREAGAVPVAEESQAFQKQMPPCQTLGEDLMGGALTVTAPQAGVSVTYVSRSYQVWGGDAPRLKILLEKQ